MEWQEADVFEAGPKMLYMMAWSLLPLAVGIILLIRSDGLLATAFLALGIMQTT